MNENLLKLKNISKHFKTKKALNDISFDINKGEIVGFLGPSGAGKTTTIKIVTNQLKPTGGSAFILGEPSTKINESVYEQIGIVSDNSGFYEDFSVYENLKLFADILEVDKKSIDSLIQRVGLSEQRNQKAAKLSRGQGQRLVLARAVLHKPKLLFLDEPTSGLDPSTALEIHKLLIELKNDGMGIFLTTHNMHEATKLCNRVALLNEGYIVEYGSPEELCLKYNTNKQYQITFTNGQKMVLEHNEKNIALIAQGMNNNTIEAIHSCEPNLENVFLEVTGRELQ